MDTDNVVKVLVPGHEDLSSDPNTIKLITMQHDFMLILGLIDKQRQIHAVVGGHSRALWMDGEGPCEEVGCKEWTCFLSAIGRVICCQVLPWLQCPHCHLFSGLHPHYIQLPPVCHRGS